MNASYIIKALGKTQTETKPDEKTHPESDVDEVYSSTSDEEEDGDAYGGDAEMAPRRPHAPRMQKGSHGAQPVREYGALNVLTANQPSSNLTRYDGKVGSMKMKLKNLKRARVSCGSQVVKALKEEKANLIRLQNQSSSLPEVKEPVSSVSLPQQSLDDLLQAVEAPIFSPDEMNSVEIGAPPSIPVKETPPEEKIATADVAQVAAEEKHVEEVKTTPAPSAPTKKKSRFDMALELNKTL
ncbi:hypothetical protein ADEAN_000337500 [Angomonas deanei]|uniref:Uncharacterized protein n=1 Tax=Angomonas deanei TaxID=59799 RepID=A0A7G2CAJ3_9TRYP|nr:hypothetical protein ADEAN_000337500 [Angomonas deanei]